MASTGYVTLSPHPMRPRTILLIEDDPDSRHVYGTMLRHAGYQVLEAVDGEEGVRAAREHHPDLVVIDLGLPQLDGWQVTEILKRDHATASIPVVAVTVHIHQSHQERATQVGCDSFLEKPCTPHRLVREVQRFL